MSTVCSLTAPDLLRADFLRFALNEGVLRLGSFKVKSGRISPYFFNAGLFNTGASLNTLARFYAQTLTYSGIEYDMLFGPAYKGIALAASTAMVLAEQSNLINARIPFAFNRKEVKDHGEGGSIIGAPLQGKIVVIDDVITAGTSVYESLEMIQAAGAQPVAVLIALDRMEKAGSDHALSEHSAVQEITRKYAIPVISIACLTDILVLLENDSTFLQHHEAMLTYRMKYGVS